MELSAQGNETGEPLAPAPTAALEICDNFVDDDADGFMDAEDPESCSPNEEGGNMTATETTPEQVATGQNMTTNEPTAGMAENITTPVSVEPNGSSSVISPSSSGPASTCNPASATLRRGSQGAEVTNLQNILLQLGYSVGPSGADGDFGGNTEAAVIKFQQDKGLTANGMVDPNTWNALCSALSNSSPVPPVPSIVPTVAPTLICQPLPAGTPMAPMKMSQQGISFLEKKESRAGALKNVCSDTLKRNCKMDTVNPYGFYNDSQGFCTAGIGHLVAGRVDCASIDNDPALKPKKDNLAWVKNKDDAYNLKSQDLPIYEGPVNRNSKVQLTQHQFDGLVSLAFNVPAAVGPNSGLMKLINSGSCDPAAIEAKFKEWNKARDPTTGNLVVLPGLTDRRTQEAAIFNFGRY